MEMSEYTWMYLTRNVCICLLGFILSVTAAECVHVTARVELSVCFVKCMSASARTCAQVR